ncbi:MAG: DNA translocase FtsK 4TM domain-containing protein, partial [Bacteroidota bacterium]
MAKNTSSRRKRSSKKKASSGPISVIRDIWDALQYDPESRDQTRKITAWVLLFLSVISLISCISYYVSGRADQSLTSTEGLQYAEDINNWLGWIGANIAELLIYKGFGVFGLAIPLYGLVLSLIMLEDDYYHIAKKGAKYLFFILLFGSIFFSYIEILSSSGSNDWGGGVGHTINFKLFNYIGQFG